MCGRKKKASLFACVKLARFKSSAVERGDATIDETDISVSGCGFGPLIDGDAISKSRRERPKHGGAQKRGYSGPARRAARWRYHRHGLPDCDRTGPSRRVVISSGLQNSWSRRRSNKHWTIPSQGKYRLLPVAAMPGRATANNDTSERRAVEAYSLPFGTHRRPRELLINGRRVAISGAGRGIQRQESSTSIRFRPRHRAHECSTTAPLVDLRFGTPRRGRQFSLLNYGYDGSSRTGWPLADWRATGRLQRAFRYANGGTNVGGSIHATEATPRRERSTKIRARSPSSLQQDLVHTRRVGRCRRPRPGALLASRREYHERH